MPIYIESKGIVVNANPFRHEYLVYVPIGDELNYDAWVTIGAYPSDSDVSFGTGSDLFGQFINELLKDSKDAWSKEFFDDIYDPDRSSVAEYVAMSGAASLQATNRQRELVYSGADRQSEDNVWGNLVARAEQLDSEYTYKVVDLPLFDSLVFGPTVNSNSFITSILRSESLSGTEILAFETDLIEPGNHTWLGSKGADSFDANLSFAPGDEVDALYGGADSDYLIGRERCKTKGYVPASPAANNARPP